MMDELKNDRPKGFWPLFTVQFLGAFNDNFYKNCMVILATFKMLTIGTISPQSIVAMSGGVFILPFFLFSAFSGELADKWPKGQLVRLVKDLEVIVMTIGALAFFLESMPLLMLTLFFMGLQSTLFGPVKYSILPEIVKTDELVKANALVEMGTFLAILMGTVLAGLLVPLDHWGRFGVGPLAIFFALLGSIVSRLVPKLKGHPQALKIKWGLIAPTKEIIRLSKKNKPVHQAIIGISWFWFFGACLLSLFPPYVKEVLHGNEELVTFFLSLFSIAVAIGSMFYQKLCHKNVDLGPIPLSMLGMGIFMLDLCYASLKFSPNTFAPMDMAFFLKYPGSFRIIFDLFIVSLLSGPYIVPLYAFIQEKSREDERSRMLASNNIYNALYMVIGSVFLMLLHALNVSIPFIFLIIGLLNIAFSYLIYKKISEHFWRFMCWVFGKMMYKIEVKGVENIPKVGSFILVCNHVTFIDWMIISADIPRPIRFVIHYAFVKIPIVSLFFKGAKVIPIAGQKEDRRVLLESFQKISYELNDNQLVCLFPEGEITYNGELGDFKNGIDKILERDPRPVIPMALVGLKESFFGRYFNGKALSNPKVILKNKRKAVQLIIAAPLEPQGLNAKILEEKIRTLIFENSK